ncbi:putative transcription factor interactor and regulator CCHC(Zn) family [Helianthus annuus]|nr:putative transcription factor interactor and regulator CCHC(Zn) family [Helianthus annuus]
MAKGKLILICQSGGEFVTNEDGTMSYKGGEANAANITSETPFNDLKLNLAETCDLNQDTLNVKYFLPGNKRNLITVKNDKDLKRMIEFHGDAITAEVFVSGTPGFNHMKNDEAVDDENIEQVKAGPKKNKKPKKEDKVVKSPIVTPARTPRRSAAAAKIDASKEKEIPKRKPKQKTVSSDDSKSEGSTSDSEQDNVTVDSDISSDYVPSRYSKRKTVNTSPADGVKKRRRTPTWKIGADGRPTIVSGYVGSNSRGSSGGENEQALKVGGGNEEVGEKVEVVDEKGEEKMEIEVEVETTGGENEEGGKIEDEKEEVEITGGENEEGGKMEGQKEEVEKDEGVFVLPPIPAKPVDVMEEKMDWDETDMETKRTVTCTKCKQPGHNKKSCDMYQAPQAC